MKNQFSQVERAAGLFVLTAFAGLTFVAGVVGFKQGWFTPRHHFKTTFTHGEGLHAGTVVQMMGLPAGYVDSVSLSESNQIEVKLNVTGDFAKRIRGNSVARTIRASLIGDKVIDISLGNAATPQVLDNSVIVSEDSMDLMDLLSSGKIGPYLDTMGSLLQNLRIVAEAFSDPKRSRALVGLFDQALPALTDFRELSHQATKNQNLKTSLNNLAQLTSQMNEMLPSMLEFSKNLPELGANSAKTMEELAVLTKEMNKFMPVLEQVAPQLPEASQKSVEALKEAVVVLRAMQKSFLLRGAVKDVIEEDEKLKREPASK